MHVCICECVHIIQNVTFLHIYEFKLYMCLIKLHEECYCRSLQKKKQTTNSPMYSLSCVQPLNIDLNFLFPPYKNSV